MPEAWDLAPDSERTVESIATFILFCEDKVNEPSYFKGFEIPQKIKINIADDQKSSFKNIKKALAECEQKGLLDIQDNKYKLKEGITENIWCVYDRDLEVEEIGKIDPQDDIDFTLGIQSAEQAGLRVAWSNDIFELWILLHFEDVEPGVWRHRSYIYDRLTAIFKALPNQSAEMAAITNHQKFSYKLSFKREAYFNLYVKPHLASRLKDAIKRAKALEAAFTSRHGYHQCNPCTKVHHLVASLLSFA